MKSCEDLVSSKSEYYVYSPSRSAMDMFLYPLQCGHFVYLPGYHLVRESFESLLLIYVEKGNLLLRYEGKSYLAGSGDFIFLDCDKLHEYSTEDGCKCLWCHFDGPMAQSFYRSIAERLGNVFALPDGYKVVTKLQLIMDTFEKGRTVREPLLSKYLNDILTAFLLYTPSSDGVKDYAGIAEDTITYINEHFAEDISIGMLANRAGISPYHFIRSFKRETGFTPHEYIINTRMAMARYLLKNTQLPIKDICFQTGFSGESVFCSAFKKKHGMTPVQYRSLE